MIDRRRLLLAAGALPLAATSVSAATPQAAGQPLLGNPDLPQPDKTTHWAIVGLGTFATGQMMPAFRNASNTRITALVSGNPQKARDLGAAYGVSKLYDYGNFDTIAANKDIDCVYIALPPGLHADYTIRALKAGKHVLCEKPMASTVAECEAMIAAAKTAGKQLGVAYRCHFEPNNADAVRRLKAGEIGKLRHVSGDAGFDLSPDWPPHKWRAEQALAGGGSMYDIGIYALNAAIWAAGEDPISVTAVYSYPKDDPRFAEVEGGVEWRLRFASGISAQGSSSYCYTYASRHQMFGSEGNILLSPSMDYGNIGMMLTKNYVSSSPRAGNPVSQFTNQIEAFSDAVLASRAHTTPGEMGLRDVKVIQAIYQSAARGGAEVTL
ncbi:Gfo/Idh/MocA family protein [Asticcacaulis biprosthecium]|nr:Gfo/Idh/MocA family oxidoreductase [Asticcacaulis biprosthecium]